MQTLHDFSVYYKIIMPFMYFDNSVTCKVTANRGEIGSLIEGKIFLQRVGTEVKSAHVCHIFHASRSMAAMSKDIYTSVFSCQVLHFQSGYECICSVHVTWA
jgi:hypothetical protein